MPTCLVALGSNVGDRRQALDRAVELLSAMGGIGRVARSGWHATRAIGGPAGQSEFLNGAIRLETDLAPEALFSILRQIERDLGRTVGRRWAPRTLDLDLLLYGRQVIDVSGLIVPHPRMSFRRFVLIPSAEVARDMVHPKIGWTIGQLLAHLDTAADYVAIAGPALAGKTWLAEQLHARFGGRLIRQVTASDGVGVPTADQSGQAYGTEIRCLRHRVEQLDESLRAVGGTSGGSGGSAFAVSDYWFDQSLAYASYWLSGDEFERFHGAWQAARTRVMRPKVLVVLDTPAPQPRQRDRRIVPGLGRHDLDTWNGLRKAILDRLRLPGGGPTLWLSGRSRGECLAEVGAAVEAMR